MAVLAASSPVIVFPLKLLWPKHKIIKYFITVPKWSIWVGLFLFTIFTTQQQYSLLCDEELGKTDKYFWKLTLFITDIKYKLKITLAQAFNYHNKITDL